MGLAKQPFPAYVAATDGNLDGLIQKLSRLHPQSLGNLLDDRDRRITRTALDVAAIGPVDIGMVGERETARKECAAAAR